MFHISINLNKIIKYLILLLMFVQFTGLNIFVT